MEFEQDYDVVVAGAGVAGVAAALEAARCGAKTALVEKTILLGGLATCFAGLYELYTGELFLGETLGGRTALMQASDGGIRTQGLETDPDVQSTFLLFGIQSANSGSGAA